MQMMVYYTYPAEKAVNSNTKEVLTKRKVQMTLFSKHEGRYHYQLLEFRFSKPIDRYVPILSSVHSSVLVDFHFVYMS